MSFFPDDLYGILRERIATGSAETSYTKRLIEAGPPLLIRKLIEECGEVAGASVAGDPVQLIEEMADLWYHALVLLAYHDVDPDRVTACLRDRHETR